MRKVKGGVASLNSAEYDTLIEFLRGLRESKGVSQGSLSLRLSPDRNYVYKIESKRRRIDVIEFVKLVQALEDEPGNAFIEFLGQLNMN